MWTTWDLQAIDSRLFLASQYRRFRNADLVGNLPLGQAFCRELDDLFDDYAGQTGMRPCRNAELIDVELSLDGLCVF